MIAVTFAHPSESRDFVRLIRPQHNETEILHTGVGGKACRERSEPFLEPQSLTCSSAVASPVESIRR